MIDQNFFPKNDWDHFHDVILDVTYNTTKLDLTTEEMFNLFNELPEEMRIEAFQYGMSDTPWRDSLWVWYEKNKM